MAKNGLFITFEGCDGSGKSTQARALFDHLVAQNKPTILTREPGGSEGAESIRRLLVEGDPDRWSPTTEILLFMAARSDHVEKTINPALTSGQHVISDRFVDSTRVYQGVARAEARKLVDDLHARVIGLEADLTFIVDVDPETALNRGLARNSGEDRFEDLGLEFQIALRRGFRNLAEEFPDRCVLIDGNRAIKTVTDDIVQKVNACLSL